jgi:hypothetical protein
MWIGRAMVQVISRRPLTAEDRVRCRVSPCGIYGGQIGTGTDFPRVLLFFPVNFIPPVLHYMEKRKKRINFITGLHNKAKGCGESVASANVIIIIIIIIILGRHIRSSDPNSTADCKLTAVISGYLT